MGGLWGWFLHITGADNEGGVIYALWSGAGGDIGSIPIVFGVVMLYRKHTCHVRHCWRLQRHPVAGTDYVVCAKHHPRQDAPTHAEILAEHRAAR